MGSFRKVGGDVVVNISFGIWCGEISRPQRTNRRAAWAASGEYKRQSLDDLAVRCWESVRSATTACELVISGKGHFAAFGCNFVLEICSRRLQNVPSQKHPIDDHGNISITLGD